MDYSVFQRRIGKNLAKSGGYGQITGVYYVANESVHNETNTRGVAQEQFFGTKIRLISQGPQTPNMVDHAICTW